MLREQAINMENELKDLLDSIKEHRLKFHALNYFTTQQLLQIRRHLGDLKQDSKAEVTAQLHSLLSTFSLHITSDNIKNAVNKKEAICTTQESINETTCKAQLPSTVEASAATELGPNEQETMTSECMGDGNSQHKLKLQIENLSKEEEEIFEQLLDLEYSNMVCYNAVKQVFSSNSVDKLTEAITWCFKNASQYDDISTDSISTDHGVKTNITVISEGSFQKEIQLKMEETPLEEDININHVVVQKLIESKIATELAIEGAKIFNGDFKQAYEWCLKSKEKNTEPQQQSSLVNVLPLAQLNVAEDLVR